ncbi:MAG: hypothetical protein JW993_09555 [Sedimentisphaerales bacterium]|nr:hypothetical protein [Sedimentisphaerales bacterium]
MKRTLLSIAITLATIFITPGVGYAVDLFGVEVTYSGGTITQSASSLPDLVDALINNQGDFAPLIGSDFTGSLTYYGLPGAVTVDVQGTTQLTITSPLTGLNRTFTGTSRSDLENQLEDWLLEQGDEEVARLIEAAAQRSAAAITDGNPSSATARMADRAFGTFGLYQPANLAPGGRPSKHAGIWFHTRQSKAETPIGIVDGADYEIHIPWWVNLGERVSLIGSNSGQYLDSEGTEIYGGGLDLGLGIWPVVRGPDDTFGWQITPFAGLHALGTYGGAAGGLLDQFGVTNRLEFKLSEDVLLVVANQFSHFDSLKLEIEDVEIDPQLDQQVVKNAVSVDLPLSNVKGIFVNGFITDTRFLQDAAVDNYQTLGGGLSLRRERMSLNAYVSRDFAGDFRSWNAGVGFVFGL